MPRIRPQRIRPVGRTFRSTYLQLERLEERTVPAAIAWDGGPTGNGTNWLDAANWRDNEGNDVLPGVTDDVTVNSTGSSPLIVVGGSSAVRSITSTRNIQLTSGTLSVGATANRFGSLMLDGGAFSLADGANLIGGDIVGPGMFTNAAGRTLTATNTDFDATVINNGTFVVHGTVRFNAGVSAPSGSILRIQGDAANGAANIIFPGGFTNNGTLELSSFLAANNATITINGGTLTNASGATFSVQAGAGGTRSILMSGTSAFNNQGTLNVGTNFTLSQVNSANTSTSGTVNIDPTAMISVTGPGTTFNYQGGSIAGGGTLSFTNNIVNLASGSTITNGPALTVAAVNTTINGPGTLANAGGATLNLRDDTIGALVTNSGTMILRSAVSLVGGLTTTAGSTTRVLADNIGGPASLTIGAGGASNAGTFELTSSVTLNTASFTMTGGTFANSVSGTFNVLAGAGGARTMTLNTNFINQGTFNLPDSDLTIQSIGGSRLLNGGTLTLGAATTLTTSTISNNGGQIVGAGTIAAGVIGNGSISPGSPIGRLTVNGNATFSGLMVALNGMTPGTLYDQLAVNGVVTISGALTATLGYTPAAGDVLRIIDNNDADTVSGTFTGLAQGASVMIGGTRFIISYTGATGNDVTLTVAGPVPTVGSVKINGGSTQRSMVKSMDISFNQVVNLQANVASAFMLSPVVPQLIASTGFNDASGLNSSPTFNSPFNVNNVSINGQGVGEPGWLGPWAAGVGGTSTTVVNSGQAEGDGALFMQNATSNRVLQLPMSGITSVQFMLKIPSSATNNSAFTMFIRQQANTAIGAQWQASADGHFRVNNANENGVGDTLDTGFLWTPGDYQTIRVDINVTARTWEFFVDGMKFNAPQPLHFREAPTFLDKIEFLCEIGSPNGAFIDGLTVTRRDPITIGSATAATVGGVTVVTLSNFSGIQTNAGSLNDGSYTLTVFANQITATGQQLDGNGDGVAGDNYVLTDNGQAGGLFRLFGDANGDRTVDNADFFLFRLSFLQTSGQTGYLAFFDFNGDGAVDNADFFAFRSRFLTSI